MLYPGRDETDARRLCIGVLSCLDGYMNIALEQTEEYVNGVRTNSYGDAFIRGNNGTFCAVPRFPLAQENELITFNLFRIVLYISQQSS